jgi:hypothetical protein
LLSKQDRAQVRILVHPIQKAREFSCAFLFPLIII